MDTVSLSAIILLVLMTFWWILKPLWQADESALSTVTPATQQPLEELYHRRDAVYAALKDLELDLAADKVSAEDYQSLYDRLTRQAAGILRQIDHLVQLSDDSLEEEVDTLLSRFQTSHSTVDEALRDYIRDQLEENMPLHQPQTCPACQHTINPSDAFCSQCGISLSNQCPNCNAPAQLSDLFCSQCGVSLVAEAIE